MDERVSEAILKKAKARRDLTVEGLIDETSESINGSKREVTRHLYWLWKEKGELRLEDPDPPLTLWQYVKSMYSLWFWVLATVVTLTASTIYLLPQTPPYIYVRYILGSLFVLYLPGFAVVESLFPRKGDITSLERLALSIGSSLALVPLIGLTLNYSPWGIRLNTVFTSLAILTLAFSTVSVDRKFNHFKIRIKRMPVEKRFKVS